MTQEEKLEALSEVFDGYHGSLIPAMPLDDVGWDSMAVLSVIALLKTKFNKQVSGAEIRAFETIGDILDVMEK